MLLLLLALFNLSIIQTWAVDAPQDPTASVSQPAEPIIHKLSENLYVYQASASCFMAMERIILDNKKKWSDFMSAAVDKIHSNFTQIENKNDKDYSVFNSSLDAFANTKMQMSEMMRNKTQETWIVYASDIPPSMDGFSEDLIPHIEMSFTVSTQPYIPFTNHMGIARNPLYAQDAKKHARLSIDLHAFAARVSLMNYPHKIFMINGPLPAMRHFLMKALPEESYQNGDEGKFVKYDRYGNPSIINFVVDGGKDIQIPKPDWLNAATKLFVVPLSILAKSLNPLEE